MKIKFKKKILVIQVQKSHGLFLFRQNFSVEQFIDPS